MITLPILAGSRHQYVRLEAGEENQTARGWMKPQRLALALWSAPFIKAIGRRHASALLEHDAEGGQLIDRLGFRVDAMARLR